MKGRFHKQVSLGVKAITTAGVNGDSVDIQHFDEFVYVALLVHNVAKSSNRKLNAKLQHSDSGTGSWTTVAGGTFQQVGNVDNSVQFKSFNVGDLKRYIRISYSRSSSGSSFVATCSLVGWRDPRAVDA